MALTALATTDARIEAWTAVGLVLVAVGLAVEAVSDEQKQRAKATAAQTFVRSGLFARTRHPNYLGEIVFQLGVAVTGLTAVASVTTGLAVVLAPIYIIALMASMVLRGEASKRRRYADDEAFAEYMRVSGALLPRFSPAR
jgi:steroid 5-alpha reductase family enzyme